MKISQNTILPVEETWQKFVRSVGGTVIEETLTSPNFNNADYHFPQENVIAELKEIHTEFMSAKSARKGFEAIIERLIKEEPNWRPPLLGGNGDYPSWFSPEYIRLARAPISRILKKANLQIRETKRHFNIESPTGVLICVNEGFTGLDPNIIVSLAADLLKDSYSSINCFIYTNLNRRILVSGSDEPKIIWYPTYNPRAQDGLVSFVNSLGREWFDYLQNTVNMEISSRIETESNLFLENSRALRTYGENGG